MNACSFLGLTTTLVLGSSLAAQTIPLRATPRNPDNDGRGRCTAVVRVDGAAEVEIRGDTAVLRNLSGTPAQWRRFECTGPVPNNPVNFRFNGVDGRGRQTLIGDPRDGRGIAVRLEDPQGGADDYKFDIAWDDRPGGPGFGREDRPGGPGFGREDRDRFRDRRFSADDAVRACQDAVAQQASERFRMRDIRVRNINLDNDRRNFVVGMFEVRREDRDERFRFSCAVDFEGRRVRDVQIDPLDRDRRR